MGLEQTPVSHTVPIHHTTQQRVVVFAIYCKKVPEVHQLYYDSYVHGSTYIYVHTYVVE